MSKIYFYCQPVSKEITTVTKKQLDDEARGGRVVIEVDSSDAIMRDQDRICHYKLNAAGTALEASGVLTDAETLADANWRTLDSDDKIEALRDFLVSTFGL